MRYLQWFLFALPAAAIPMLWLAWTAADSPTRMTAVLAETSLSQRLAGLHESEVVPRATFIDPAAQREADARALAPESVPEALLAGTVVPRPAPVPFVAEDAHAASTSCPSLIVEVFGARSPQACAIVWCESSWNPNAVGDGGASLSYFQVQPRWHQWRANALFGPGASLADPMVNVHTAYAISGGGWDWSAWTCRWVLG